MCNLYSMVSNVEAIRAFASFLNIASNAANLGSREAIFANGFGPIVRNTPQGRELAECRWGMPSPEFALQGKNYDSGVTNVRKTESKHWKRWLGVESRCVVPATSFSEPDQASGSKELNWFALSADRPLFFFAGVWTPQWTSCRKVKDGVTCDDLYAFLTTDANDEVKAVHPKAMPVILRTPQEVETWLTASTEDALQMQKPLPNGTLKVVAKGQKKDGLVPSPIELVPPQAELF